MPTVTIKTPDGKTLNVPFSGTPPTADDVKAIIADYETQNARAQNAANIARMKGEVAAAPTPTQAALTSVKDDLLGTGDHRSVVGKAVHGLVDTAKTVAGAVNDLSEGAGESLLAAEHGSLSPKHEAPGLHARLAKQRLQKAKQTGAAIVQSLPGGTLTDLATAAGLNAGGQPGMAQDVVSQIPGNYQKAYEDDPVTFLMNALAVAAPVAGGAIKGAGAAQRAASNVGRAAAGLRAAGEVRAATQAASAAGKAADVAQFTTREQAIQQAKNTLKAPQKPAAPPVGKKAVVNSPSAEMPKKGEEIDTSAPHVDRVDISQNGENAPINGDDAPNPAASDTQNTASVQRPTAQTPAPSPEKGGGDPRLVEDFPVADLHTDAERFQYKMGSGQGGQTGSLTGAPNFNKDLAGLVHVWRDPADGKTYIVNGHNRTALANRTGQKTMDVRFLDAPDAQTARTTGALINIAEGQGTPLDAAKLFRDEKFTPEELKKKGVNLSGATAQKGLALSNLSPALFGQTVRGELPMERAVVIGSKLPKPEDQMALVGLLDRAQKRGRSVTNDLVSELADQVKAAPTETKTTSSLFGDDEQTQNLALHRADVAAYLKSQMSADGRIFGGAAGNADRLARANNVIDADASRAIAEQSRQGVELFDRLKTSSGPVSDILNNAARRLAAGEKANDVKAAALDQFREVAPSLAKGDTGADSAAAQTRAGVSTGAADGSIHEGPSEAVETAPDTSDGGLFDAPPAKSAPSVETAAPSVETAAPAETPTWKYEEYSAWSQQLAKSKTVEELQKQQAKLEKERAKAGDSHLRALERTSSMQSNSQARAQTGNAVRGNYEERMAVKNALEIHQFYPDKAKSARIPAGAHGSPIQSLSASLTPGKTPTAPRIKVDPLPGGTAKKLSDIVLDLGKSVRRRVTVGKAGKFAGFYVPGSGKTLIRFAGDLDTTAHEVAHALDDAHGIVSAWNKPRVRSPYDAELAPFAKYGSGTKSGPRSSLSYQRAEGVAEFIRAYIVNPNAAKAAAPNFYQHFVSKVPAETLDAIHGFSDDVRQFAGLPAAEKIAANVGLRAPAKNPIETLKTAIKGEGWDFETTGLDRLQAAAQDSLKPFTKALAAARKVSGAAPLPMNDPLLLARVHSGVGGKVLNILDKGMIDQTGKRVTPGGLKWLLEPFDNATTETLTRDLDDTVKLMVAQRTLEKGGQLAAQNQLLRAERVTGIGGGLESDRTVAAAAIRELKSDPARFAKLEEGAKRYRAWADSLLQYQVEKGRMSHKSYLEIKASNQYYVALNREMDKLNPPRTGTGNGNSKLGSARENVQKFTGSTREIQNPYRTLSDQTHALIKDADRNEVLKAFRDMLVAPRGMHEGAVKNLAAIGQRGKVGDANTIKIFVDGKPEYWQFEKGVYETLKGFGSELQLPKIATFLPAVMRAAVTHSPGFLVRNVFRDAVDRTLLSKHGGKPWDIIGKTNAADRDAFDLSGGGQAGHYLVSKEGYGKALESAVAELAKDKKTVVALPGNFLERYEHIAHSSEALGRFAEYRKALAHAKTKLGYDDYNAALYAASEARGLMDFAVAGNMGRVVNSFLPFTNAAIQGSTNLLRAARANPKAFLGKWAAFVVLPEVAVYAWNASQGKDTLDEYRELPAYQRDLFWNVKAGPDTWIRIPKGFEAAVLASGVSRSIDRASGNAQAFEGYTGSLAKSFIPVDEQAFAGPLRPFVEGIANYDFFRGSTIVPPYENDLRLDLRKGAGKASRLGQALSHVFGADPRKIDHYVRSQFGEMGTFAERATDLGRADRATAGRQIGLALPGLLTTSPALSSPDVQFVMTTARALGKKNPLDLTKYYAAETSQERDEAAADLRAKARELRPEYERLKNAPRDVLDLLKPPKKGGGLGSLGSMGSLKGLGKL